MDFVVFGVLGIGLLSVSLLFAATPAEKCSANSTPALVAAHVATGDSPDSNSHKPPPLSHLLSLPPASTLQPATSAHSASKPRPTSPNTNTIWPAALRSYHQAVDRIGLDRCSSSC